MKRKQYIEEYLKSGFNCAQIVALAFAEKVNKDEKTVLAAAAGFGGGIGRQAMICGALSGAVIILGFAKGQTVALDSNAKEMTYKSVRDLFSLFKETHGAVICKDLLECDISTPDGLENHKNGCNTEKCIRYVESSMNILNDLL